MKNYFYYLEIILTVLIGACGIALIIGGLFMKASVSIIIGCLGVLFAVIMPMLDRK